MKQTKVVAVSAARQQIAALIGWVEHTGNRVEINRHGRRVAAIVTMDDLARLEEFETKSLAEKQREMEARWDAWQRVKRGMDGGPN